ncbi:MAG: hypothetical protein IJ841_05340 [Prevotella sp.]|nr:hypothetical protein [Prevotella sp.]
MRKRIKENFVCSGRPEGQVMDLSSRELEEQVRWGMKAVECSTSAKVRAWRGLELGFLCEHAGHPALALQVWMQTLCMVQYDNWELVDLPINTRVYRFDGLYAYTEEEELGYNIDRLWRQLGHEELARFRRMAKQNYRATWLYKYQEASWE